MAHRSRLAGFMIDCQDGDLGEAATVGEAGRVSPDVADATGEVLHKVLPTVHGSAVVVLVCATRIVPLAFGSVTVLSAVGSVTASVVS